MKSILAAAALALSSIGCAFPMGPVAAGEATCVGLSQEICTQVVDALPGSESSEVSGFRVRCTADAACSSLSGDLDVDVVWSDGTRTSESLGWANGFDPAQARTVFARSGVPIPTPPVPPDCMGVPPPECQSNWMTAMENVPTQQIDDVVRVLVECTSAAACTPTSGAGRVTLQFRDGTTLIESTWGYENAP